MYNHNISLLQNTTTWKCYRCDLMFDTEQIAAIHNDIFKHPVKKIDVSVLN